MLVRHGRGRSHFASVLPIEQSLKMCRCMLQTFFNVELPFELPFREPLPKFYARLVVAVGIVEDDEALETCAL